MKNKTATIAAGVLAAGLYFGLSSPAYAPVDMFLKIDGIDGESKDKEHDAWINVESWSWGETGATRAGRKAGGPVGTGPGVLTVTKTTDKASPKLQQKCNSGQHIPKTTVSEGNITYTLYDVRVSCGGSSTSGDRPTEEVSFYYNKISFSKEKPKRVREDKRR